MFNNLFQQGSISICISRGVNTLLRKNKDGGWDLDNYRPITLLNTVFKLVSYRLQSVARILLGKEQTYSVVPNNSEESASDPHYTRGCKI